MQSLNCEVVLLSQSTNLDLPVRWAELSELKSLVICDQYLGSIKFTRCWVSSMYIWSSYPASWIVLTSNAKTTSTSATSNFRANSPSSPSDVTLSVAYSSLVTAFSVRLFLHPPALPRQGFGRNLNGDPSLQLLTHLPLTHFYQASCVHQTFHCSLHQHRDSQCKGGNDQEAWLAGAPLVPRCKK